MAPRGRPAKRVHHITGKQQGMAVGISGLFGNLPRSHEAGRTPNIMEGSKTSQPLHGHERFEGYPVPGRRENREKQNSWPQKLENLTDLQLHIPNSSFLGYFGKIQDQLRGIALTRRPLISPSRFLDQPAESDPPAFRWQLRPKAAPAKAAKAASVPTLSTVPEPSERGIPEVHPAHPAHPAPAPSEKLAIELAPTCSWMRPGDVFAQETFHRGFGRFEHFEPHHYHPYPRDHDRWHSR